MKLKNNKKKDFWTYKIFPNMLKSTKILKFSAKIMQTLRNNQLLNSEAPSDPNKCPK